VAASRRATAAVLLVWCLVAVGNSRREGEYTRISLLCIVAGFVILATVVATGARLVLPDRALMIGPVTVCLAAAVIHPSTRYMFVTTNGQHVEEVLSGAAAAVALLALVVEDRWQRFAWIGVLALSAAMAVDIIRTDPVAQIDVWVLLQQSSSGLLHGLDMYRQHWVGSNGLQDVYPYLPITTIVLAPFKWLLGDVRYGLTAASLLGAYLVRRTAPEAPIALAALILIVPHWAFLVDQSWTEPILIAALAGAVLALRSGRSGWAVLCLALALACKQHIVLLLPLFAVWPQFGLRRTITAGALAFLAVLPWIIAGPRDIWHDAVHADLALGVQTRADCIPSFLLRHGVTVGFWFLLLFIAIAYALTFTRIERTPSGLALGCALVMLALDVANKESYFNHYLLPLGLLVIAVAAADRVPAERAAAREPAAA
jgi:hypothetical protein